MCFLRPSARGSRFLLLASVSSLLLSFAPQTVASAQEATSAAQPAGVAQPAAPAYTRQEIEKLVAPIALYPDPLLAQVLPASAYPTDIVQASRWLARNQEAAAKQDFSAADAQNWDPSVKALLRFPTVLEKMNVDLDWTADLGDAFVNQPQDVAAAVQALRAQAAKAGALQTTPQQKVVRKKEEDREIIVIEPADPDVIYVPAYDPVATYNPVPGMVTTALLTFGTAVAIGAIINNNDCWRWSTGAVYRPVWPGYPAWRPPYPGWRPGMPARPGGNINIGNSVNIGNNIKPWRPDPDRYRPGLGSKPGLARPVVINTNIDRNTKIDRGPTIRPDRRGDRPRLDRPLERPSDRPRPAQRPRPADIRPDGAFGGLEAGSAAGAFANRGQASRDKMNRPQSVNRPAVNSRPAADRPAVNRRPAAAARPAAVSRPAAASRPAERRPGRGDGPGRHR